MGGTQIGGALNGTYTTLGDSTAADIFLVTDGEVSSWAGVVKRARQSGHRIFTIGVGSAVAGGVCSRTGCEHRR